MAPCPGIEPACMVEDDLAALSFPHPFPDNKPVLWERKRTLANDATEENEQNPLT